VAGIVSWAGLSPRLDCLKSGATSILGLGCFLAQQHRFRRSLT